MANLQDFINHLESKVGKSIYVWGGQGQHGLQITKAWIRSRENSITNINRVVKFWEKLLKTYLAEEIYAYDCSGLGMHFLYNMHKIFEMDLNSNSMMRRCKAIQKSELAKGDWVFRTEDGKAYHIGYVVDDKLNVIHAKGRDVGVIKESLAANGNEFWTDYGRSNCFAKEIGVVDETVKGLQIALNKAYDSDLKTDNIPGENTKKAVASHILYDRENKENIQNAYVKWVQEQLIKAGLSLPKWGADGEYGGETETGVKEYQKQNSLLVDGKVGTQTVGKMIGGWKA